MSERGGARPRAPRGRGQARGHPRGGGHVGQEGNQAHNGHQGQGVPRARGGPQARGGHQGGGGDQSQAVAALSTSLQSMKLNPGSKQGSMGQPVKLLTNYVGLRMRPETRLYQYRVDFNLEEDRTHVKRAIVRRLKNVLPANTFDGSVLYSLEPLYAHAQDSERKEMGVRFNKDEQGNNVEQACEVTFKLVGEVANTDHHYISFLNSLLKRTMEKLEMQQVGRNLYDVEAKILVPSAKLELWPGYVTAIRHHEDDLLVCVDVNFKVVRQSTVLDSLNYLTSSGKSQADMKRALIGCIFITRYNNKTYRLDDIDFQNTPRYEFVKGKTGFKVTLHQYFQEKYGLQVKNMQQPLLVSMPTSRDVRGGRTDPFFFIPELCNLTGLDESMKSNFRLMNELAQTTRPDPPSRLNRIRQFIRRLQTNTNAMSTLEEFKLCPKSDVEEVEARILPMESIRFGLKKEYKCSPDNADFTKGLNNGMLYPKIITRWVCIYPERDADRVNAFLKVLSSQAGPLGVELHGPLHAKVPDSRVGSYTKMITEIVEKKPNMIMVIIPNDKSDAYAAVKKKVCVETPVPSQVVTFSKVVNKDAQKQGSMAKKIVVQMATKLGGCPWGIKNPLQQAMYIGFDTYHDTQDKKKSVGALVASMDSELSRYFCDVAVHESQEELSNEMARLIFNAVQRYYAINGHAPKQIFMYRDGVGDGQIPMVKQIEVEQTLTMLKEFSKNNNIERVPLLVYTIVSKRINTKFFRPSNNQLVNPCSGTVVDSVVTLPERYDFFVVGPTVRQGTVNPTGYNIIHSDLEMPTDKHQWLAYKWTHLYFNWSGTVKVPGVCQNAHKLAKLVGENLHQRFHHQLGDTLFFL